MKNLQDGMTRPCCADIKLGSVAYNPKKMERQQWKMDVSTSGELGLRLCGLSYFEQNPDGSISDEKTEVNKYKCRSLKKDGML